MSRSASVFLCLVLLHAAPSELFARDFWTIREAAWKRPFGTHPPGATALGGQSRTKRGIPLGGIGAGSFMYNLAGSFGPWEFQIGKHEEKFLPQAAFHYFEQIGNNSPTVRTLATEDVLEAWPRLPVGSPGGATYAALYPRAWVTYDYPFFATDLSLKQLTPVIRKKEEESSLPVAVFVFRVSNPSTSDSARVALLFTFPNQNLSDNSMRIGFDSKAGVEGQRATVVLSASSPVNDPDTQGSEWAIATEAPAGGTASYISSWSDAEAANLLSDWKNAGGVLSDTEIDQSHAAGAVAAAVTLAPGASAEIAFTLAWDFPVVQFGGQASFDGYSLLGRDESLMPLESPVGLAKLAPQQWWKRYTEWYRGGAHASAIAMRALDQFADWDAQIEDWTGAIAGNTVYPLWLRRAALNELYYDTFGGVFWANTMKLGALPPGIGRFQQDGGHLFFSMESPGYPLAETFDVRHYESNHLNDLWPTIERDTLRLWADFIEVDPQGHAPHDAGATYAPFVYYGADPGTQIWTDLDPKFILQAYQHYLAEQAHDPEDAKEFLSYVWPAMKRGYEHLRYTRTAPDTCIPLNLGPDTTYDLFPLQGTSSLTAGLWVAALEAMKAVMVTRSENDLDQLLLGDLDQCLQTARSAIESQLWNPDGGYYQIDTLSPGYADGIMADATLGQYNAETIGLPDVLRADRVTSHLREVYKREVLPFVNANTGIGVGAINAINKNGTAIGNSESDEVWTGVSYLLAATMYRRGKRLESSDSGTAGDLEQKALDLAYGVYFQTYENETTAYWFETPEAWQPGDTTNYRALQYMRPRAVWELLRAIQPPYSD